MNNISQSLEFKSLSPQMELYYGILNNLYISPAVRLKEITSILCQNKWNFSIWWEYIYSYFVNPWAESFKST